MPMYINSTVTFWTHFLSEELTEKIQFASLNESHFTLIHQWFNKPHVQAFYSLRSWTYDEVRKKLKPNLQGEKGMKCFIIYHGKHPVGYIQSYPTQTNPFQGCIKEECDIAIIYQRNIKHLNLLSELRKSVSRFFESSLNLPFNHK